MTTGATSSLVLSNEQEPAVELMQGREAGEVRPKTIWGRKSLRLQLSGLSILEGSQDRSSRKELGGKN